MSLIEWKESYALGIPDVDHEHRELIALINELHEDLRRPDTETRTQDFLGEIHARISAHFALEEKVMREHDYDALAEHKEAHEALLDDIRDLMDEWEDGSWVDLEAFSRRLDSWFTDHFRTHDARLHHRLGPEAHG